LAKDSKKYSVEIVRISKDIDTMIDSLPGVNLSDNQQVWLFVTLRRRKF